MILPDETAQAALHPAAPSDRVFTGHPVKLSIFEGPLDLLLYLIERDEVDIFDIPIERITNEYLVYLNELETMNLEVAGEFIVMASQLLEIKSRMLLPKPEQAKVEEEEAGDPRAELVARLLEYRRYKRVAEELKARAEAQQFVFSRGLFLTGEETTPQQPHLMLGEVSSFDLWAAFQSVLNRVKEPATGELSRPRFTVSQKIASIASRLKWSTEGLQFVELFEGDVSRIEVIVSFLALLELVRLKRARVLQDDLLGEIRVYPIEAATEL